MRTYLAALCAIGCASVANAQLTIITSTTQAGQPRAMYYNLSNNNAVTLWNSPTGTQFNGYGIVADDANNKLYYDTSARLGQAAYGNVVTPLTPSVIGGHYYADAPNNNPAVAVGNDLTMANGSIYSWSTGSTTYTRGIYRVDPTLVGIKVLEYALWTDSTVSTQQYDFQALAYRAKDGLFYGINGSANHAKGLYSIDAFGSGAVNFISALPAGKTHLEGMTFDDTGDTLYMGEMDPSTSGFIHNGQIYIASYDMASSTYGSTYSIYYDDATQRGMGMTWSTKVVPEPATCAALAIGAVSLLRRRRK